MTLEEAIQHAKETVEEQILEADRERQYQKNKAELCGGVFPADFTKADACIRCAEEHQQLAEWLEELKDYRDGRNTCEFCKHVNKAENEFPCSICKWNHPSKYEPREEAKHG